MNEYSELTEAVALGDVWGLPFRLTVARREIWQTDLERLRCYLPNRFLLVEDGDLMVATRTGLWQALHPQGCGVAPALWPIRRRRVS